MIFIDICMHILFQMFLSTCIFWFVLTKKIKSSLHTFLENILNDIRFNGITDIVKLLKDYNQNQWDVYHHTRNNFMARINLIVLIISSIIITFCMLIYISIFSQCGTFLKYIANIGIELAITYSIVIAFQILFINLVVNNVSFTTNYEIKNMFTTSFTNCLLNKKT